jgi:RES domain
VDPGTADIEYLPTQYLSDLIRHVGYDGIAYPSAMGGGSGKNVVLFDTKCVVFETVSVINVRGINYTYDESWRYL